MLIAIAIIGIVAAITIPTIQNNLNRTELETGFAKAFSTLSHVVSLAQAENGALTNWDWKESYTKEDLENFAKQYILPYMNVSKNCKTEIDMGCMSRGFGLKNGCIDAKTYCAYIRVDVNGKKGPTFTGEMFLHLNFIL